MTHTPAFIRMVDARGISGRAESDGGCAMTNPALNLVPKKNRSALLERERKLRRSAQWGATERNDQ